MLMPLRYHELSLRQMPGDAAAMLLLLIRHCRQLRRVAAMLPELLPCHATMLPLPLMLRCFYAAIDADTPFSLMPLADALLYCRRLIRCQMPP